MSLGITLYGTLVVKIVFLLQVDALRSFNLKLTKQNVINKTLKKVLNENENELKTCEWAF